MYQWIKRNMLWSRLQIDGTKFLSIHGIGLNRMEMYINDEQFVYINEGIYIVPMD